MTNAAVATQPSGVTIETAASPVSIQSIAVESEAVLAKTAEWATKLGEHLPIEPLGVEWLTKRLRETSVMRRKVQSILQSQYLVHLTPQVLREKIRLHGLDPYKLLRDGQLVIDKETEHDVLLLLNEDLWTGDFSGEQYAAARKSRR